MLAPNTLEEVDDMRFELEQFRKELEKKQGKDAKATALLVDARLEMLEMRENLVNGQLEYRLIRVQDIDCSSEGALNSSVQFFESAYKAGERGVVKLEKFSKSYSELEDVSELKENLEKTSAVVKEHYGEMKAVMGEVC